MNLDFHLFRFINNGAKKSRVMDFLGVFCAQYLGWILVIYLAILAYQNHSWQLLFLPIITGLASLAFNELIYLFYKRKRPMEMTSDNTLIGKPFSPAFPSSHTSFFFALSLTLFLFNFQLGIIFLVLSFLIALSRIFCGVHWPSDILGGIISAVISFLAIQTMGI